MLNVLKQLVSKRKEIKLTKINYVGFVDIIEVNVLMGNVKIPS